MKPTSFLDSDSSDHSANQSAKHFADRSAKTRKVRTFQQKRAAATYEALLRAAAELFSERGFDAVQAADIAAAAGMATGTFYRYFIDKQHAFREVVEYHLNQVHTDVMARLSQQRFTGTSPSDIRAALDEVLATMFEYVRRHKNITRVYLAMSLTDPDVARIRAEFEARDHETLAELIRQLLPHLPAEPTALVVRLAAMEVALERSGLRPGPGAQLDDVSIRTALREMLQSYLFGALPAPG